MEAEEREYEELTLEEIKEYQRKNNRQLHTYRKYGTLAKQYLENHNVGLLWQLGGDLPEYLHGIDKAADALYETLYSEWSNQETFKKTGNFLHDLRVESDKQHMIEERILSEIVYIETSGI